MSKSKPKTPLGWCFKKRPVKLTPTFIATSIITMIMNIVTAPVAVVGNMLILILIYKYQSLRKPCNILIASLALSDTLVGLIVQPLLIVRRILNFWQIHYCSLRFMYVWGSYVLFFLTLCNMALVSIDRCLMIAKPFTYNCIASTKRYFIFLSGVWLSINIFVVSLYCLKLKNLGKTYLYLQTVLMFIPLIIIIACCAIIYWIAVRQKTRIAAMNNTVLTNGTKVSKKANSILILALILLVCYLPQIVLLAYRGTFGLKITNYIIPDTWADTLTFVNSAINPFVFCYRIKEFKEALMKLLGKRVRSKGDETTKNTFQSNLVFSTVAIIKEDLENANTKVSQISNKIGKGIKSTNLSVQTTL